MANPKPHSRKSSPKPEPARQQAKKAQPQSAELLRTRFRLARKRLGLDAYKARWDLDLALFKPPPKAGDQLTLL